MAYMQVLHRLCLSKNDSPKGGPFSPIPGPGVGKTLGAAEPVRGKDTTNMPKSGYRPTGNRLLLN